MKAALAVVLALGALGGCAVPEADAAPAEGIFASMGEPLPAASAAERELFERGREVFGRRLDASTGLGPAFSAASCVACHEKPVAGGSAARYRNAFVRVHASSTPDLDFQAHFLVEAPWRAPDDPALALAGRNPVPLFGAGLLDEIPADEILSRADPRDIDGDGISGRVSFERGFVGRFGRKAQIATLEGFVRLALIDHLGVTSDPAPRLTDEPGPVGLATGDDDAHPDPELPGDDVADLVAFVSLLAPPAPDPPTEESQAGRMLFDAIGCAECHTPALHGPRGPIPAYTDLLLHDMGEGLSDGAEVGSAGASEFRTQPLWGLAATGPYLHDGRADTIDEAILAHGGEAIAAAESYASLTDRERAQVVAFLESLGGREQASEGLLPPGAPIPAFGTLGGPVAGLDEDARARFERGRAAFDRDFTIADGLGPAFNGDSCRGCHFDPVIGGAGPSDVDVIRHAITGPAGPVAPAAGTMAHRHDLATVRGSADPAADVFELRQTPAIFGLGLVEAIPDEAILALADPDDADGDGVSGRAHVLADGRVGRFGWKAGIATLEAFARDAFMNEMGISEDELAPAELEDVIFFMVSLAPPPRRSTAPAAEGEGAALFDAIGCASCHTPSVASVPLYSDLLLHDVAYPAEVGVPEGNAGPREMRTPPLWGLTHTAPYMHDGSAPTVEAAIALHDGEARSAREGYETLTGEQQRRLISFLESL